MFNLKYDTEEEERNRLEKKYGLRNTDNDMFEETWAV